MNAIWLIKQALTRNRYKVKCVTPVSDLPWIYAQIVPESQGRAVAQMTDMATDRMQKARVKTGGRVN